MKKFRINIATVILSISLFFCFGSCIKEMEIESPDAPGQIVINCLFSPDNNWKLSVSKAKQLSENEEPVITDATVTISSDSNEVIVLNYNGDGFYTSGQKPVVGKDYRLHVEVPGFGSFEAQSKIPEPVAANVEGLEIKWMKYLYPNDLMDYDVFPIHLVFDAPVKDADFLFRALVFNPENGYKRYLLTNESLNKLQQSGIPKMAIGRLAKLAERWQLNTQVFYDCFSGTGTSTEEMNYQNMLRAEFKKKNVNEREYEAFIPAYCFADDTWVNNISYDTYTVIGRSEEAESVRLLFSDPNLKIAMEGKSDYKREFWVEATRGDSNYRKYFETYILQLSQRVNPYSEPVKVFSNIENGAGIFAGYHRQMIHLFNN
jgi:hypothetical protein